MSVIELVSTTLCGTLLPWAHNLVHRDPTPQVQVIPWVISDSNYVRCPSQRLDPSKTVFVGALHGMLNAEALASIMNDLFGGVMYAGIDTDKHKYPIGEHSHPYLHAMFAARSSVFPSVLSGNE